ncbi:MAG TPA: peptidoglycan DD-metalloendopeptidase family protein [Gaiellaceae bacterium]|nr:peptidoglycan DD-metalloendopeptidase family protein [Gaiellaceae bacterium]
MRPALRQLATVAVCGAAALAGSVAASADSSPICVETGVLAVQASASVAPVAVGPALGGPVRTGTTAPTVSDVETGLRAGAVTLGVAGCVDDAGTPGGTTARATHWSILGGAVTGVTLRADLVPALGNGAGWRLRTSVAGLRVEGRAVELAPGGTTSVGDWGVLRSQSTLEKVAPGGVRWWRAALQLRLSSAHAGFPAGTTFLIGWAVADRQPLTLPPPVEQPPTTAAPSGSSTPAPRKAPATTTHVTAPKHVAAAPSSPARTLPPTAVRRRAERLRAKAPRTRPTAPQPLRGTPPLGAGPYTFPVAGDVSFGDTYGAARSDVSDGWHHGDDLFAPLGTPVVAVTDGTIFSVGWNHIGGWRLWLLDAAGDEFYYAHLSGYTALGANGRHVQRGDVLGYVGNTGDAVTTDTHLHFEIHPVSLLYLGYDGAVDPTTYLDHWVRPTKVHTLPPVPLPGRAPTGWGAVRDFRKLLAIRPMHHRLVPRAPSKPVSAATSLHGVSRRPNQLALNRRAVGPQLLRAGRGSGDGDGSAAAIAGILLVAAALVALFYTVRSARTD